MKKIKIMSMSEWLKKEDIIKVGYCWYIVNTDRLLNNVEIKSMYNDYIKNISIKNIPVESEEVKSIEPEKIKPKYYELKVVDRKTGDKLTCDLIDVAKAMGLSNTQFLALRYFRKKGNINKQINDTDKAIESLKAYKEQLTLNK